METTAYKKLLLIFFALSSLLVAQSQQYPDSLIKYLDIAGRNNPDILLKFNEYQASLQKIPQVGSLSDPELSMGVFLSPMELVNGKQAADIRIMQMFPWFGVLKSARDEMSLMANAKFELFRDTKLQVFYEVQRTWYELYKIQKEISISEENIEILKTIERLAISRFKAPTVGSTGTTALINPVRSYDSQNNPAGSSGMQGMGTSRAGNASSGATQVASSMQSGAMGSYSSGSGLADLYRIQIEAGDLENNIALLRNQRNTIIAQFNSYLNRPVVSPVYTPDLLTPDSLGLSLVSISDSMLAKNPMLGMLGYEEQSLDARKKMVSRMGYPMVGLGLNYSLINKSEMVTSSMNGKDMIMPMVTVTLPVYRKKYIAMQKETDLLKTAASQNFQVESNRLQTEYYQALQLYQDAKRRVKLYDNQSELASKSFDLMLKSFSVSASDLADVLRVQQQKLDYEIKKTEAVADLNTSIAWLKRLGNLEMYGSQ